MTRSSACSRSRISRTVDQALTTFGRLSGIPKGELDGRIKETLVEMDILETRYRKINQLSGGTVQKVGMAQAIMHRPKLLVLDELRYVPFTKVGARRHPAC